MYANGRVAARRRAYVGDFGFDLDAEIASRGPKAVLADHPTARLALVLPDGIVVKVAAIVVKVAATGMHFPNGSVITPDGRTLIVAETLGGALTAFDIAEDGSLLNRRVWAPTLPRLPDGIASSSRQDCALSRTPSVRPTSSFLPSGVAPMMISRHCAVSSRRACT